MPDRRIGALLDGCFRLLPNFITSQEERMLYKGSMKKLDRMNLPYAESHFDKVISQFRECSLTLFHPTDIQMQANDDDDDACINNQSNGQPQWESFLHQLVSTRVLPEINAWNKRRIGKEVALLKPSTLLPCHILDMAPTSYIDFHLDNVEVIFDPFNSQPFAKLFFLVFRSMDNWLVLERSL